MSISSAMSRSVFVVFCAILVCAALASPAAAQNRLSIATSVLDAPGGEVDSGADFRYRISYSCDLVSIPTCDNATVTVDLPPELEFRSLFFPPDVASGNHDGSPTGGTVTFTFQPAVTAGNTGDLEVTVRFPNGSTADGTMTTGLTDAAESSAATLVTQMADLPKVTARANPQIDLDVDLLGGFLDDCPVGSSYRVSVGPSTANGSLNFVVVNEVVLTLPTGVTGVSPNDGGVYDVMTNTVTWTGLGGVSVGSTIDVTVDITFANPPFTDGQTVSTFATADVNALGELSSTMVGPIPFDHTVSQFVESPDAAATKGFGGGRPSGVPPAEGQAFSYNVGISNTGNIELDSITVVDDGDGSGGPIDADLDITAVSTGAYDSGYTGTVTIRYTTNMAPAAVLGSSSGNTNMTFSIPALGAGEVVTAIQWDLAGPIPVGTSPTTAARVDATVRSGSTAGSLVDNHLTVDWAATLGGPCGGPSGPATGTGTGDSFDFTVSDPYTYLRPSKNEVTTGPYFPGNTITFDLDVLNDSLANDPANGIVVTDLLPRFLTFQAASETFADNGTGVSLSLFENIDNYNGTGRTLLRWTLAGDLDPGEQVDIGFQVTVELGVLFGQLTNTMGVSLISEPPLQLCATGSDTDAADLDGDSDTTDDLCTTTERVTIAAVAQLSSVKSVQGQCDTLFIPGLGTGTSLPGGLVDWRVQVQNVQTVPMENFVIVDILPFVGDTGVRDLTPRLSLFRPILPAPITPPPGGAVFYSTSGNPCRPEVGGPTSGCDAPNWTTVAPDPISDVQSVKIEFGSRVLSPLDVLQFQWPMILPADAPTDGSEAFNSFAFGSTRQDDGGFLAAEPNKVGIDATCAPMAPDDAMLGNFVWIDSDGDGEQDPAEVGVNNVPVDLFDPGPDGLPRTADDVLVLSTVTADDAMGNPGWYKFSALMPGDYYVLFHPPLNFTVTVQDAAGEAVDSDADPVTACTDVVTLAPSENNPDIDLGLLPPVTASLGNYVWFDLNGDGRQNEASDRGINGATVRLFADDGDGTPEPFGQDGTPLQVTVTADDPFGAPGYYLFENLIPGVPYFVQFVEPSPATGFTTRNAGSDDTIDSDARSSNGTTPVVTLAAGEHNPTLDAGIVLLTGTLGLGNVVWLDDDGNGVVDVATDDNGIYDSLDGEVGIDGVRLNLYLDVNLDGLPQVDEFVATTLTQTLAGEAGRYRFDDLPAGDFMVEVDASNFASGGPLEGRISSTFSTVDPNDDMDHDDSGDDLGPSVVSPSITLSVDGEPTPDAEDDLEDDNNINFTLDFGFIPGTDDPLDFGDNPDAGSGVAQGNYRTVAFDNGAFHPLLGAAGPFLGDCVDADNGQQQNFPATADDLGNASGATFGTCATASDDEDGVTFSSSLLAIGGTVDVTVSSSSATGCLVNGWIDWNRNGSFGDTGEQILTDEVVASGSVPFVAIPVPSDAVPGFTYARFRCSTGGGDGPTGMAVDGEVEDYRIEVMGADWGDAPDVPYGTLQASGGPLHDTDPDIELYLGSCVDTEADGQPTVGATGDDTNLGDSRIGDCVDDEDGVVFTTMLLRGQMASVTVTASMAGRLDAWLDFNGTGGFEASDQIATNLAVTPGPNVITFTVPVDAAIGLTYSRFRYSTAGGLSPGGLAADGEVEDHAIYIKGYDFGDVPDPEYPTVVASTGAQHIIDPLNPLHLGVCADTEDDGQSSAMANGDDTGAANSTTGSSGTCASNDDEDGVTFDTMLITCQQSQITVVASSASRLDAWIDYDRGNGNSFGGTGDQIFANRPLTAGANVLTFDVPCTAELGETFARFRVSSAGGLAPGGLAMDGEVEDYAVFIKGVDFGDAADTHGTTFGSNGPNHGVDPLATTPLHLGACVDTEPDARMPLDTTGDDVSAGTGTVGTCAVGNDDEDGVTFTTMLAACNGASVGVVSTAAGILDAWVDFNGDGDFGEANERIFNGQAVVAGNNSLPFNVPCAVDPDTVSTRFRLSSTGVAGPTGPAMDGEVEDYNVLLKGSDLGDNPDTYATLEASNGPSHVIDPSAPALFLGTCVDTDLDGQPNGGATGDDDNVGTSTQGTCTGNDDEDGVTFDTLVTACKSAEITVTASAVGLLDAWIDFDGDGGFGEAGDQIFTSEPLAAGPQTLSFGVPCSATSGTTYARFRLSSTGGLSFNGPAMDGEVEDYVLLSDDVDFGDAPDTYGTSFASGGPVHGLESSANLYLGACVDSETDGQPSMGADGDDTNTGATTLGTCTGNDDEDGVTFDTDLVACQTADITVTASTSGLLDAWFDFGIDDTFAEPVDQIFTSQALTAGSNSLSFTVPCDAVPGTTYVRFRVSTVGGLNPGGTTPNGEIEDYAVTTFNSDLGDAPDTYQTSEAVGGPSHRIDPMTDLFLGACVDTDTDGQPSVGADGDDTGLGVTTVGTCGGGTDDEDGVTFDTMINVCLTADITVTAFDAGFLDAWIDLDGDNTFNGVNDQIFNAQPLVAGPNALSFNVPCDATPGDSYVRFRFSSTGGLPFAGPADDGEVEDYAVLVKGFDFGDAPDPTYPTLLGSDGARHIVLTMDNPTLGTLADIETEGQQSANHQGDDVDGVDDEDGITWSNLFIPNAPAEITVEAGATGGLLNAWIDYNQNGNWNDPGEQVAIDLPVAAGTLETLALTVDPAAVVGATCARFRFSSAGSLLPTGQAPDGEVEDYEITVTAEDPSIGISKMVSNVIRMDPEMSYDVTYVLRVENFGNIRVNGIQVTTDFATAYAEAEGYSLVDLTSPDFTVNPLFDGDLVDGDVNMLTGVDSLDPGMSGEIQVTVNVMPGSNPGPYVCSSMVTGTTDSNTPVEDESQNGPDPDENGNNDPEDDDEPTPVVFELPVVVIPTLDTLGLAVMALMLMLFAVGRMRRD